MKNLMGYFNQNWCVAEARAILTWRLEYKWLNLSSKCLAVVVMTGQHLEHPGGGGGITITGSEQQQGQHGASLTPGRYWNSFSPSP